MKVMVIVKATKDSEAGQLPSPELLAAMGKYNEELVKAGIMQAGEGLKPSSAGKRIRFSGKNRTVIDGPFAETKEQLLGFYVIEAASLEAALADAKELAKASGSAGAFEIRPLHYFAPGGNIS